MKGSTLLPLPGTLLPGTLPLPGLVLKEILLVIGCRAGRAEVTGGRGLSAMVVVVVGAVDDGAALATAPGAVVAVV